MSPDLELALALADAADAISLPRFRSGLAVETKPDLTPVTEADRAVEAELRRRLATERAERRDPRRGGRHERRGLASLDPGPDRRHAELRPRSPGLGDADRARGRMVAAPGRRLGSRPRPPLVGRTRPGHVRRRRARDCVVGRASSRKPCSASRTREACPISSSAPGTFAVSETSGHTCSWPRAPSTGRWTPSA